MLTIRASTRLDENREQKSRYSLAHAPNGERGDPLLPSPRGRSPQPALASQPEQAAAVPRPAGPAGRFSSAAQALRGRFLPSLQHLRPPRARAGRECAWRRIIHPLRHILPGLAVWALAVTASVPVPAQAQRPSDDNTLRSLRVTWGSDTYSLDAGFRPLQKRLRRRGAGRPHGGNRDTGEEPSSRDRALTFRPEVPTEWEDTRWPSARAATSYTSR